MTVVDHPGRLPMTLEGPRLPAQRPTARLVVILPCLNEEATLAAVISRIPRNINGIQSVDIIVADDGSSDRSAEIALEQGAFVVRHATNLGVGAAFKSGVEAALSLDADIIVNMDSDGQFKPEDIPTLVRPILDRGMGFVTCSRFGDPALIPTMPWIKKWGNGMMARLVNWIISSGRFTDVSCGFRAYARDTALRLNLFGQYTYTQETFIDLASKGIRMCEIPLEVRGVREFGESRVARSLWRYGSETLPIILRTMRDVRPLEFFGGLGLVFFNLGLLLLGFVGVWWLATGRTHPWTSVITLGVANLLIGLVTGVLALLADQLGRVKRVQEEMLYISRKNYYDGLAREHGRDGGENPGSKGADDVSEGRGQGGF